MLHAGDKTFTNLMLTAVYSCSCHHTVGESLVPCGCSRLTPSLYCRFLAPGCVLPRTRAS